MTRDNPDSALNPDHARLAALARYQVLDTPSEAEFDDITRLASIVCGVPIALISLIDGERQWFKSRHGLSEPEAARNVSFCTHAIEGVSLFEVADATADARFRDNPLVTGAPHIRFYAGAPLVTEDGFRLGTLCVIDRQARELRPEQREALQALSRQVMRQLEIRRAALALQRKSAFQEAILNSTDVAIIASDEGGMISAFNRGAETLFGYRAVDVVGRQSIGILHDASDLAARLHAGAGDPAYALAQKLGQHARDSAGEAAEWRMRNASGGELSVLLSITAIHADQGETGSTLHVARDVSRHRAAEQAAERAEAFNRKIASRVPGVIYQFQRNVDGSAWFPYASEQLTTIFEVTPAQARSNAVAVLAKAHPDDLAELRAAIEISATQLTVWYFQYRIILVDGALRWIDGNASPERLPDGATLWHGVMTDVTQRKQAELALARNQQLSTALINALPIGVFTKSLQGAASGTYLSWNPALEKISGYPADAVIGQRAAAIFPTAAAQAAEAHDLALKTERAQVDIPHYALTRPDGVARRLRTRSVPLFDANGAVEYLLGMTEDITDSVMQHLALRRQQAEMQAASDASPLGLFQTDALGAVVYVNRKFEFFAGCDRAAALGAGWLAQVHPADRGLLTVAWEQAFASRTNVNTEFRFKRADATEVLVRATTAPVQMEHGFHGVVGTIEDITARHQARQGLVDSERRLRLITNNLPAMIGYIDADERYRFCNDGYRAALGLDPAAMLGQSLAEVYGADAYSRMQRPIQAALRGERTSFERLTRRHGRTLYLQCDYVPDLDDDGTVLGFYAMIVDITARREIENRLADSERAMRMITDNIPALVAHVDADQRYLFVNARIGQIFKRDTATMIGRRMEDEHTPERFAQIRPHVDAVLKGERVTFTGETWVEGQRQFFEATYVPDIGVDGRVLGFYAMTFDISASRESELRQAASEARLRTITDNLPVLITYIDKEVRLRFANATVTKWLGRTPEQAQDRHFSEIVPEAIYNDRLPYLQRALQGERVEYESFAEAQGVRRHMQTIYIPDRDENGVVQGLYALSTDITALKENEIKLSALARSDTLTGLPNRYQLNQKLDEAIARSRRTGEPLAVLFLDIDHFKQINDRHGHAAGDTVLNEFAQRLRAAVRETDTVARLSGDEFVVLLERLTAPHEPRLVAEKILLRLQPPVRVNDVELTLGASIGIAFSAGLPLEAEALIAAADKALYRAKNAGRGGYWDQAQ